MIYIISAPSAKKSRRSWTKEEEDQLLGLLRTEDEWPCYGADHQFWTELADKIPGRTRKFFLIKGTQENWEVVAFDKVRCIAEGLANVLVVTVRLKDLLYLIVSIFQK